MEAKRLSNQMMRGLGVVLAVYCTSDAFAQSSQATVAKKNITASTEYDRSAFWRIWFGDEWRDTWSARIEVPVLDLGNYAGGLEPFKKGGNQTSTLRMRGGDGRTYVFRSTNKAIYKALPDDLKDTPIGAVIQDQSASFHPTAHLAVSELQRAAGLLFAPPTLVILPDDPRLGEFRGEFANLLGQIEERPDEAEKGSTFGGAEKIIGADKLLENLDEGMEDLLDSQDYLKARLIDFLIGDPDRGGDQWRFAKFERGERDVYRPIPRDRDYAFMKVEGLLMGFGSHLYPKLVKFNEKFPHLESLVFMTSEFDRSHLVNLPWTAWESVVVDIQHALTNAVIDRAVLQLPPAHRQTSGARIASGLRARRAELGAIARKFYLMVNEEADVFTSDEDERAEIMREADGAVTVKIWRAGAGGDVATDGMRTSVFDRRFVPEETREIRVYLERGDDHAVVRGNVGRSINVRVIGGEGDDVLIDSSHVRDGNATRFYDASGRNTIVKSAGTHFSTRRFVTAPPLRSFDEEENDEPEENPRMLSEERRGRFQDLQAGRQGFIAEKTQAGGARNWGGTTSWRPSFDYSENAGVIVGLGPTTTAYGFRRRPHEWQISLRGLIGLRSGEVGAHVSADRHFESSRWSVGLFAQATQLEANRFFGYGNDTDFVDRSLSLITRKELSLHTALRYSFGTTSSLAIGPVVKYVRADIPVESPAETGAPLGSEPFGQIGARADLEIDETVIGPAQQSGLGVSVGVSGYPAVWDAAEAFGEAHAVARLFVPLGWPTVALRAGGQRVWGAFPLHEAAFLGGLGSLRGFSWNRFAGDASAFASAELRVPVARITLLTRGQLGVIGFTDAGRVWLDGESAGDWHTSAGGGLWFSTIGHSVSLAYAKGEQGRIYLSFGLPF